MKKILIVGAGGIGSWLASHLYELYKQDQLGDASICFADDDTVDTKNLTYQNFKAEDITDLKVNSLSARYGFSAIPERITTSKALEDFDCVISAVDNTVFRKLMFKALNKKSIYWLDLRSEGKTVAIFTKHKKNTVPKLLQTIPTEQTDQSCQRQYELEAGIVQNGNKIVAAIASQFVLNWLRAENNPPSFIANF